MLRVLGNLIKAAFHLSTMGLVGYVTYHHRYEGDYQREYLLGVNLLFALLGASLVWSWARKKRRPSEELSEALSLPATATGAGSAASPARTGRRA